ncbi:MAG: hypothetical protein ACJ0IZ_02350 [Verrucomicrobiales bacterium]
MSSVFSILTGIALVFGFLFLYKLIGKGGASGSEGGEGVGCGSGCGGGE